MACFPSPTGAGLQQAAAAIVPRGSTALVGVLGDPVRHSLSPTMHNAALAALELDWIYLALPTPATALATVLEALEALDCQGLNVTIPHKQAVAALVQERTALAERVGAVNTLVRRPQGGWLGTNTDVEGFLAPLRGHPWAGEEALVLGCGGSARAVVAGLVELGLARIQVAGRRPDLLEAFCRDCRPWAPQLEPLPWTPDAPGPQALNDALRASRLLVNTTPVGMASSQDPLAAERCPLDPRSLEQLRPGSWVYDLIYTPRPTRLLRHATALGHHGLDGLEMLVQQGAAALRLWSGLAEVPVAAMRQAALDRLEG